MKPIYLLLGIVIIAFACKPKRTPEPPVPVDRDIPGPAIQLGAFPLQVGHMWVYSDGDTIRTVSDTVIKGEAATKFTRSNGARSMTFYCANRADGLYMLAASAKDLFYSPGAIVIEAHDTLYVPDSAVQLTKLPIVLEQAWTAYIPYYADITRSWVKYVMVPTPAGNFNTVKLSAGREEYYSEKGIVKFVSYLNCITAPCPPFETTLVYVNF